MARVSGLPNKEVINAMKGTLDFYSWKGIAVVRRWPRYTPRQPSVSEAAVQSDFSYINKVASQLPSDIIDQYKAMAVGTPFTWKDLLVRGYMHGFGY